MHALIDGGFYSRHEAILLVTEMALITTCLATIVWLAAPYIHPNAGRIGIAIRAVLETWLLLVLYTSAVVICRDHWTPAKGMSEYAAFMPVIGHVNAAFFAEAGWLEYVIVVIPAMSVLSGLLALCLDFYQRRMGSKAKVAS